MVAASKDTIPWWWKILPWKIGSTWTVEYGWPNLLNTLIDNHRVPGREGDIVDLFGRVDGLRTRTPAIVRITAVGEVLGPFRGTFRVEDKEWGGNGNIVCLPGRYGRVRLAIAVWTTGVARARAVGVGLVKTIPVSALARESLARSLLSVLAEAGDFLEAE